MQLYKYKGYADGGGKTDGEILAETIEEAERRIAAQAITIISIIPAGMRKSGNSDEITPRKGSRLKRKISESDASAVLRNLAVMAETGVPFIEALDAIIDSARTPRIEEGMCAIKEEVINGRPLSTAMKSVPWMFPPIICDLIRVAEEAGQLHDALDSGAEYLERAADLKKRIVQAMLYPAVMLSVAFLTVAVLVVFVMPKFADIFTKMQADVPATTQAMLSIGNYIRSHPINVVGMIIGAIVGFKVIMKTPATNRMVMALLLKVPGLGLLLRDLALSRALQSISTMLSGNVPVMDALEQGARVAGNEQVSSALISASKTVEHGGSLAEGLGQAKIMPKMLIQMVAVGERTGRLSQLMITSAHKMDEEASARLKSMVALLEPVMIVVMGVLVGTITISVITPIYSVVQNLK